MRSTPRWGFSVVELLVTVSIVALLAALIVPAVMSIRESSRRMQCMSRIADLGRAVAAHEASRQFFPTAVPWPVKQDMPGVVGSTDARSAHLQLLPYIDQSVIAGDVGALPGKIENEPYPDRIPAILRHPISLFLCPSDFGGEGTNFRFCTGASVNAVGIEGSRNGADGAFPIGARLRSADFRDGLSNTVCLSERTRSPVGTHSFGREDFAYSGLHALYHTPSSVITNELMIETCRQTAWSVPYYQYCGHIWATGCYNHTLYNHAVVPNSPVPDCSASGPGVDGLVSILGVHKASSVHTTGVNVLFLDGHVKYVANGIDLEIWRAIASRSGREVIDDR